jgi:hypothetical protein
MKKRKRTETQKQKRSEQDQKRKTQWKQYRLSHLDEIARCRFCKSEKPLRQFLATFSRRHECLKCVAEAQKQFRKNHPAIARKISAKLSATARKYIADAKKVPCQLCGKSWPPYVMDFHHGAAEPKTAAISKMTGSSVTRISKEMAKCKLVCANCHRNETHNEEHLVPVLKNRTSRREIIDIPHIPGDPTKTCAACGKVKGEPNFTKLSNGYRHSYCKTCLRQRNREYASKRTGPRLGKAYITEFKDNRQCKDCGKTFRYWMLDFDHVSGSKTVNVSKLQLLALHKIKEEIAKCELVCVNCHRIRTHERRHMTLGTSSNVEVQLNLIRLVTVNTLDIARTMLDKYHYAGYGRTASNVFAAMHRDELAAVIKFAPVVRKEVATKEKLEHNQVLELDRFCISPRFQIKNMASKVMSLAISAIRKERPDVKLLVSFADTAQGHEGTIYKASNWTQVGTCATSYVYERQDGTRINKKVVYDTAKKYGLNEKEYAASLALSKIETPGKHKFVYWLK